MQDSCTNVQYNRIIYECTLCNYSTYDKRDYSKHSSTKKHINLSNGAQKIITFKCDECSYSSTDKSNFNKHILTHEGIFKKAYGCDACGKSFRDKRQLDNHLVTKLHKTKVIENFPKTLVNPIYINDKLVNVPNLNISLSKAYIHKYTKTYGPKSQNKPIKAESDKMCCIHTQDYQPYYLLDDKTKYKLVHNAIGWMRQNGIDPCDEAIYDDATIDEQYIAIYNLFSDVSYFKTIGLNVKNIE